MNYGHFDQKNREYVITRPDTPTPWINYLGVDEYCAIISNTAGGYSFHKDPRDKRILRYRYNNLPVDRPGRYLYLCDKDTGEFWSCSWQPVMKPLNEFRYECRHGLGYTKISAGYRQINSEVTYFVPRGENLEIWILHLKNSSSKPRNLAVFSYAEFCLWQAVADAADFQYTLNIANCISEDRIIYHLTNYYPKAGFSSLAYLGASRKPQGFDCDRERFIGPYRSESNPLAVEKARSFNSRAVGGNPIGSQSFHLKLKPKQEQTIVFVLGVEKNKLKAKQKAAKFTKLKVALGELAEIKKSWQRYLDYQVATPDKELNAMVNTWNAYQCHTTFNWSRSASYYEAGIGRGMGFRDSNQDCLGVLHSVSKKVKQRITDLASNQFKDGSSFHQYFPLTKKGDKTGYSDDHLWLIISTVSYIKESGDRAFLDKIIPFANAGKDTLYNHLSRAIDYSFKHVGKHKLPLMGYADWNDCLNNMGPGAESVWVGQLLCFVCRQMAELAGFTSKKKDSLKFTSLASKMEKTINRVAWDGSWYIRAFDSKGRPVGSSDCREGKIYLNPQSWAVMAGIAPQQRLVKCMDMVAKNLDTKYGIILLDPPYRDFDPQVGAIGTFAPGLKENSGIFCHANPWAVIAEVILGRAEKAFDYYKKIAPATHNKIAQIHMTEPYIYSQFISGRHSPEFGRAKNSWLTGSATWNFIAVTWYILGIRPEYRGLRISPCIPGHWPGFRISRRFRKIIYKIEVLNPQRVSRGVKSITVDGKKIEGDILPFFKPGSTHRVKVIMGSR
ncbi:MAG: glycosyl transferase [Candidatus Omnitrophota bacterium]|nr:glycosyl transferase [Candidatus Omnitrophota bacterium]